MKTQPQKRERVFLIGTEKKQNEQISSSETMEELAELAATAGAIVVGRGVQKIIRPHVATYIGKGKAREFSEAARQEKADAILFDDELSPAQTRNLEKVFECKVLDRTSLILDIFAQRAKTKEGKMQIEMAQLQHILPRLTRMWTHLSRQKGGIGMRGDGETQLEVDRRRIQERIRRLRQDLEGVKRVRTTQRQGRRRNNWPLVSIVGYTNAGKSTLLNALTGTSVLSEDKLFATLDPTTRRLQLPKNQNVFLSDTVGFIRKLPHQLVESFKATLEEVMEADILIHLVDVSSENFREQVNAVTEVLEEINANEKPVLMAFNKVDQMPQRNGEFHLCREYEYAVAISAKTGDGLEKLQTILSTMLRPVRQCMELKIPAKEGAVIARIRAVTEVEKEEYEEEKVYLRAHVPQHHRREFEKFEEKITQK